MTNAESPVGLTKDTGYQIGVRRNLKTHYSDAWRMLTTPEGAALWLGESPEMKLLKGETFTLADGTQAEVVACARDSHLIVQVTDGEEKSTIELRVMPNQNEALITFDQDHLSSVAEVEDRRKFYMDVLDTLERRIRRG